MAALRPGRKKPRPGADLSLVPQWIDRYNPPFIFQKVEDMTMFREEIESLENLGKKLDELRGYL